MASAQTGGGPVDATASLEGGPGPARVAIAWTGHHAGWEVAVGYEQILRLCGRILSAGVQAAEGGAGRASPGVAHHSAGRQEPVRSRRRQRCDRGGRQQDDEDREDDSGRVGAEAERQRHTADGLVVPSCLQQFLAYLSAKCAAV